MLPLEPRRSRREGAAEGRQAACRHRGRRRRPARRGRIAVERRARIPRARASHRGSARRHLHALHRWHDRHAEGRDVHPRHLPDRDRRLRCCDLRSHASHQRRRAARARRPARPVAGLARRVPADARYGDVARHDGATAAPGIGGDADKPLVRPPRAVAGGRARRSERRRDRRRRVREADARARSTRRVIKPPR